MTVNARSAMDKICMYFTSSECVPAIRVNISREISTSALSIRFRMSMREAGEIF
ncbi:MAG: hypothetical protein LBB81_03520 [Treponema sp.]|nr:hypothetical protein [Treponema sp.]